MASSTADPCFNFDEIRAESSEVMGFNVVMRFTPPGDETIVGANIIRTPCITMANVVELELRLPPVVTKFDVFRPSCFLLVEFVLTV